MSPCRTHDHGMSAQDPSSTWTWTCPTRTSENRQKCRTRKNYRSVRDTQLAGLHWKTSLDNNNYNACARSSKFSDLTCWLKVIATSNNSFNLFSLHRFTSFNHTLFLGSRRKVVTCLRNQMRFQHSPKSLTTQSFPLAAN